MESKRYLTISHRFHAPRETVFRMWTSAAFMQLWYSPRSCQLQIHSYDFQVNGRFRTTILTPDGKGCHCAGHFDDIEAPARIVYTMYFADANSEMVSPESVGRGTEWPEKTVVTVTFDEEDGKTLLTLHQTLPEKLARESGAYGGWEEMLDRLEEEIWANVRG